MTNIGRIKSPSVSQVSTVSVSPGSLPMTTADDNVTMTEDQSLNLAAMMTIQIEGSPTNYTNGLVENQADFDDMDVDEIIPDQTTAK